MNPEDPNNAPERAMKTIAANSCYTLAYNQALNRIQFSVNGFWKNREAVPAFLKDWKAVLQLVKPNFTLLSDLRTMITHPQEIGGLHVEVQNLLKEAGLLQGACITPHDKIAALQITSIAKQSGMPSRSFTNITEAQAFLDSISASYQQV